MLCWKFKLNRRINKAGWGLTTVIRYRCNESVRDKPGSRILMPHTMHRWLTSPLTDTHGDQQVHMCVPSVTRPCKCAIA